MAGSPYLDYMSFTKALLQKLFIGFAMAAFIAAPASAQEAGRAVKKQVKPEYPQLARQTGVQGSVKLEVVITAAGQVRSVKAMGGHPLLINAAQEAVKHWVFETASSESTQEVVVRFTTGM